MPRPWRRGRKAGECDGRCWPAIPSAPPCPACLSPREPPFARHGQKNLGLSDCHHISISPAKPRRISMHLRKPRTRTHRDSATKLARVQQYGKSMLPSASQQADKAHFRCRERRHPLSSKIAACLLPHSYRPMSWAQLHDCERLLLEEGVKPLCLRQAVTWKRFRYSFWLVNREPYCVVDSAFWNLICHELESKPKLTYLAFPVFPVVADATPVALYPTSAPILNLRVYKMYVDFQHVTYAGVGRSWAASGSLMGG